MTFMKISLTYGFYMLNKTITASNHSLKTCVNVNSAQGLLNKICMKDFSQSTFKLIISFTVDPSKIGPSIQLQVMD